MDKTQYVSKNGKKRGECLPMAAGDLQSILGMTIHTLEKKRGMPSNYPNNEDGIKLFRDETIKYFKYVLDANENDPDHRLIPDVENWALFLGITRQSIFNYEHRNQEWYDTVQFFKNTIMSIKKDLALNNKIPPIVFIFDAKNNHGYADTSELRLLPNGAPKFEEHAKTITELPRLNLGKEEYENE